MATVEDDLAAAGLELFELPEWETRLPVRQLWIADSFWKWFDGTNDLHDPKIKVAGRTLGEHILLMFCSLRCSERPGAGDVKCMMPAKKNVWKLHPPRARLYAWATKPECLVVMDGALEKETKEKTHGNLNNKKRDEVVAFIKQQRLTKYVFAGDYLALFPPKAKP
ncbi:hypothetical protein ABH999_006628 [Bradyrhizobium yuanmingense]|uniref:hypothetical protein n=1 Tax=Bradyrhizobium yuanmingense TaxID=108015 RepID=UPI00351548CA